MSLLLLLKNPAAAAPPVTPVPLVNPVPTVEIDFNGNPTATYSDIQTNQDDVISFWRMHSATTFLDERLAHNGIIMGTPTTTTSPYPLDADLAMAFDGTSDAAYVPSATDLTSKSNFSIEGWLKVDSLPGGTRDVVAKRGAWLLQLTSAGKLVWTLKDDTSTGSVTSNSVLATGVWNHVAATYNSTSISVYINGVLDVTGAYAAGWEAAGIPIRFAETPSAASPAWQSSQTTGNISGTATITKPVSTASGDLLIAHIHASIGGSILSITSIPAGWNLGVALSQPGISSNIVISHLYWKVAGASEPASYTWNFSTGAYWSGAISRFTGVSSLTPLANPVWGVATPSGTSHATAAHVPNVDNNMVLGFFSVEDPSTWTQSSGTERYDFAGTGSNSMSMCSQTQASAASIAITGTSSGVDVGSAIWVTLCGSTSNFATVSMKDWSFSDVARSADEIARDYASFNSGQGTWTDVSVSVRNVDIAGAARQYELDQMEAGTAGLLLKDQNRSFDPANTSSPYSPNVIPARRIRGRTTYQGTTYDLFYGYVERWPPQNAAMPGYQEIALKAVDGFDALALSEVNGALAVGYSGAQINALLDKALWPRSARAIDHGQYVMAAQTLSGTRALGAIQEIADSERGIFFIDKAGVATFHDSAHRGSFQRSTTSQVTFSDTHTAGTVFYQGLEPSFDKDKIVNEWTVDPDSTTFAAASQRLGDPVSIARFWRRSQSRSTRLVSNTDALAQAGNLLNETSLPAQRFDSITVLPTTVAMYQACLGLTISDRVTVIRGSVPGWDGTVLTKDCFVEAGTISAIGGDPWRFTFALSPVSSGNYYATIMRDGPVSYWRFNTLV